MKHSLIVVALVATLACVWLARRSEDRQVQAENEIASIGVQAELENQKVKLPSQKIKAPSSLEKTGQESDTPLEAYEKKYPLRISGARIRYSDPVNPSDLHRPLPKELQFLGELPPNPNQDRINEVYVIRREIEASILEDSRKKWSKMLRAIGESGDNETYMMVLTNTSPHKQITSIESEIIDALRSTNVRTPEKARLVASYLRDRRARTLKELDEGSPENPHWLADHVLWIEEAAEKLHLSLDEQGDGLAPDWQSFTDELWPEFKTGL